MCTSVMAVAQAPRAMEVMCFTPCTYDEPKNITIHHLSDNAPSEQAREQGNCG